MLLLFNMLVIGSALRQSILNCGNQGQHPSEVAINNDPAVAIPNSDPAVAETGGHTQGAPVDLDFQKAHTGELFTLRGPHSWSGPLCLNRSPLRAFWKPRSIAVS